MRAITAFWGGSMAIFEFCFLFSTGMDLLAFLIVPVCFAVGWVFAYFMWEASKDYIGRISERLGEQANVPVGNQNNSDT
jgi:hypothetical protein